MNNLKKQYESVCFEMKQELEDLVYQWMYHIPRSFSSVSNSYSEINESIIKKQTIADVIMDFSIDMEILSCEILLDINKNRYCFCDDELSEEELSEDDSYEEEEVLEEELD